MGKGVSAEGLTVEIGKILGMYSEDVTVKTKAAAKKVAEECAEELQRTSPVGKSRRKKYRTGWESKLAFQNAFEERYSVHNKNKPGVTHLLEYGHGGPKPAGAKLHIRPAEQKAIREFERLVKKAVRE